MSIELTEECVHCRNSRRYLEKLNEAANNCYYLGWLHDTSPGGRKEDRQAFNGPLQLMCHECGSSGRVLSKAGKELVGLVREHLQRETGEQPAEDEVTAAVHLVDEQRGPATGDQAGKAK